MRAPTSLRTVSSLPLKTAGYIDLHITTETWHRGCWRLKILYLTLSPTPTLTLKAAKTSFDSSTVTLVGSGPSLAMTLSCKTVYSFLISISVISFLTNSLIAEPMALDAPLD